jgi:type II secretory pathway pseudopilin PulG
MAVFRKCRRSSAGFTLIEAILSIVVISAVSMALGRIMITGMNSYNLIDDRRDALQQARLAVNFISSELETIANPSTDISAISANSITFIDDGGATVTYTYSGGTLMRDADVLASNVVSPTGFAYYTALGVTTTNPLLVYRIHLDVSVQSSNPSHGVVTIVSNVFLRNRYYDSYTRL